MFIRRHLIIALALLLPAALPAAAADSFRFDNVPRVVVIGDVHGAYTELVSLLEATGLIDEQHEWTGGTSHLVSVGDLIDRGPGSRQVLDLMMALQDEAPRHGGQVHVVLGNHEVMNLTGDLRYLVPADFAAFAADETAAERDRAFAAYAAAQPADPDPDALRTEFDMTYPPGYFARVAAFAPDGRYGTWLLELPTAIVVNGSVFVHGGLSQFVDDLTLEQLNARTHATLTRYLALRAELVTAGVLPAGIMQNDYALVQRRAADTEGELKTKLDEFLELADSAALGLQGPYWYRGLEYCRPLVEAPILTAALAAMDAKRLVVGHTPTDDRRIHSSFDGRFVVVDTGMLESYYHGRPEALVATPDGEYVQLAGDGGRSAVESPGREEALGLSRDEIERSLAADPATITDRPDSMPWSVTVRHGDTTIAARFYPEARDRRADYELAAAALDGWLGSELMPPTVARTLDGTDGALQLAYPDGVTEAARLERRVGSPGWCPMPPQIALMQAFDLLTLNRGRTRDNIVYHNEMSQLMLFDFANAFGTTRSLPSGANPAGLMLPPAFVARLRELDANAAATIFGDRLRKSQIRGLLGRRDALLAGTD